MDLEEYIKNEINHFGLSPYEASYGTFSASQIDRIIRNAFEFGLKTRKEQPNIDLETTIRIEFGTRAKVENGRRFVKLDWNEFSILAHNFYELDKTRKEE